MKQHASPAAIIRRAQAGSRAAVGELYERYARVVHAIAIARVPRDQADDVVQEVFLRVLRQLKSLRDVEAFAGWLATIARNTVFDLQRREALRAEAPDEPTVAGTQHDELEARAALAAIRALPEAYRETLAMRLVEGMTGPEIADRTGLTPASVRVNLHRGMKLLREQLQTAALKRRR